MLPKQHRLPSFLINKIIKRGQKRETSLLTVIIFNRADNGHSRFTFIVPIKTARKAVERNKIKRRLRELFRNNFLKCLVGKDVITITKKTIVKKTNEQVLSSLNQCFLKD